MQVFTYENFLIWFILVLIALLWIDKAYEWYEIELKCAEQIFAAKSHHPSSREWFARKIVYLVKNLLFWWVTAWVHRRTQ